MQSGVVHAFADDRFQGNPALVRLVDAFAPTEELQALAAGTSLPVTVFVRPIRDGELFQIRWFTQSTELDLCGHGTLAASYWLFRTGTAPGDVVELSSRSGSLSARRDGNRIVMSFPRIESLPADAETRARVEAALKVRLEECRRNTADLIAIADDERTVVELEPDFAAIRELDCRGLALGARVDPDGPDGEFDVVCRFFGPRIAIDEDQVCASVQCSLHPYWEERLGKTAIRVWMASANGGRMDLDADGDRVLIAGIARLDEEPPVVRAADEPSVAAGASLLTTTGPEAYGSGVVANEVVATTGLLAKRPFSMASFSVEPRCASEPHAHDVAEIWYIASGSGQVISEDRRLSVRGGDFVYLRPGAEHQIENTGGEPVEALSVWWEP